AWCASAIPSVTRRWMRRRRACCSWCAEPRQAPSEVVADELEQRFQRDGELVFVGGHVSERLVETDVVVAVLGQRGLSPVVRVVGDAERVGLLLQAALLLGGEGRWDRPAAPNVRQRLEERLLHLGGDAHRMHRYPGRVRLLCHGNGEVLTALRVVLPAGVWIAIG